MAYGPINDDLAQGHQTSEPNNFEWWNPLFEVPPEAPMNATCLGLGACLTTGDGPGGVWSDCSGEGRPRLPPTDGGANVSITILTILLHQVIGTENYCIIASCFA